MKRLLLLLTCPALLWAQTPERPLQVTIGFQLACTGGSADYLAGDSTLTRGRGASLAMDYLSAPRDGVRFTAAYTTYPTLHGALPEFTYNCTRVSLGAGWIHTFSGNSKGMYCVLGLQAKKFSLDHDGYVVRYATYPSTYLEVQSTREAESLAIQPELTLGYQHRSGIGWALHVCSGSSVVKGREVLMGPGSGYTPSFNNVGTVELKDVPFWAEATFRF